MAYTQEERETIDRNFNANILYYNLLDGLAINTPSLIVSFESKDSARKFKELYPEWLVYYRLAPATTI